MEALNIVIGGEAGQGLVTIGYLLAKVLVRCGYDVVVTQDYQSRIRGGHNTFRIRTAPAELQAPQEAIDLLVALDAPTVPLHQGELTDRGLVLLDRRWPGPEGRSLPIPYEELGPERYWNVTALGILSTLLGLPEAQTARAVSDFFGAKDASVVEANQQALEKAFSWTRQQRSSFPPLSPPPAAESPPRLLLNGNEAIALGALAGGLKFFAFYPMSPSTSIGLFLAAQASSMGIVVEQAEDEIAVINMALGASFAGAPSMVATSGGGFALMNEGVSLAGMTETPLVIAVCQRPGPATGLPTRTEQGDLDLVLHAGHGEFPRAILAPGSVEDCFSLTGRAFALAEQSQGPVFLLTDQFLADSYRAVLPFDLSPLPAAPAPEPTTDPYLRYAFTPDGVSPRLFPGATKNLVVADSDEHTEDGHLTEDLAVRQQMVEKRLKKLDLLLDRGVPPERTGPSRPDLLLVTWGSGRGAVLEAADRLRSQGQAVGVLHFPQVWPLRPDQFLSHFEEAGEVVTVEGNAQGQFARLLRRETGFLVRRQIRRYDGWPITPEYILRNLEGS